MGTIYEIICWTTGLRYVGQTTKSLKQRLIQHKSSFRTKPYKLSSTFVLEHGNYEIYELEKVEDGSKLREREYYHIQNNECVNYCDGRSFDIKEYKKKYNEANKEAISERKKEYHEANKEVILEKMKEYYKANKEALLEKAKEYHEANREDILERKKEYHEANKEVILEKAKEYREANKEAISERGKEKYTCECGSTLRKSDKARHERTQIHLDWLAIQNL